MKYLIVLLVVLYCIIPQNSMSAKDYKLNSFSDKADPVRIGKLLSNRFLEQPHSQFGSPLRINEPRTQISYPDVCVWLGGLWFAEATKDIKLQHQFIDRFSPLQSVDKYLQPKPNHVDNNVFGSIPLEIFKLTKDSSYYKLGMMYANTQWDISSTESLKLSSSQLNLIKNGYSWQTRIWLDDMFMITAIQAQAYKVTKDLTYINRTAKEMVLYLDSIQTSNGLFYHSPTAPFYWGRGNGWLAVGMAEVLRVLPTDNIYRPAIMKSYLKMMNSLLGMQGKDGMWNQLLDDATAWKETSGTAMFTYAMIVGVKKGWLDEPVYGAAARKAWITLSNYIQDNGDIKAVCEGTNIGKDKKHYLERLALTGDYHGQAPVLWCAYALTADL